MRGRTEPLLIADFTAGWCKPCQQMAPMFEELATEYKGDASFVKVDIDDFPEAFDGVGIPAFHVSPFVTYRGQAQYKYSIQQHVHKVLFNMLTLLLYSTVSEIVMVASTIIDEYCIYYVLHDHYYCQPNCR